MITLRKLVKFTCTLALVAGTSQALAQPTHSRNSWTSWSGQWTGDFWSSGNFGGMTQVMTCVAVDGSIGSPEFWATGVGEEVARSAYGQALDWVNVADRNPAYIEVWCGY
jgi:hypothetical protein